MANKLIDVFEFWTKQIEQVNVIIGKVMLHKIYIATDLFAPFAW